MKAILSFLTLLVLAATSRATSYTYTPAPADLHDLDHHSAYTWRIDNINLAGATITGASLTFTNIANWDTNPNILFIHLFDTAKYSGVHSFIDASGVPVPNNQMIDNFASPMLSSNPLIAAGTANTFLTSKSFTMTPTTFTYNFTAAQLVALQSYIAHGGNIAFGLDPDCHFFNDGVKFTMSVPDGGTTAVLLGLTLVGICFARRQFAV
jgi:VPDSG-CTERM motif